MAIPRWVHGTAVLVLAAVCAPAGAQTGERLPPCTAGGMEEGPCLTPFDERPVLVSEPPVGEGEDARQTPHVWMLVDETGAVRATQVGRSAGVDWDRAAVDRAKQYRFHPARVGGRPVAAWILLPVAAVPPRQTCANFEMRVPLSAGVARLVDSTAFASAELGTAYHYRTIAGFDADVYLYAPRGTAQQQVDETIQALGSGNVRGGPDSVSVLSRGAERVRLFETGGGGVAAGQSARLRLWFGGGAEESYVGVFPSGEGVVKFRATYPAGRRAREVVSEFVRQILSNDAWRARGCPR